MDSDESSKLGEQEVLVGDGRLRTTVASTDAWWSGRNVGSGGGNHCCQIGINSG